MKRAFIVLVSLFMTNQLQAQIIREFSTDTALFVSELVIFNGRSLKSAEVPVFERFLHLYDSLPFEKRMEIIEVSNLMLNRKCRPHPHFIKYQQVMMEFFYEDKTFHGYEEWMKGYKLFLSSDAALLRSIDQWLSLSLSLLEDNIFYTSNAVTWKVSTPSFKFHTDETMTVQFDDVTVACYSGRDFIQIMNATGYIDPHTLEWIGSQGRVTWERVGIPESEMHALLGDFKINLKTPHYSADSVRLYYPARFEGEVVGRMEDKVMLIKNLESAKYPQFVSYRNSYKIDGFSPGVNYRGGMSVEGGNLVGSGLDGEPAVIEIYSNDTLRIRVQTFRATMNERFLRSPSAAVSIYFGEDSIYHPDLVFAYDVGREALRLNKSEVFTSLGPYSNSYHNIDMNFDELFWNRGESTMRFQALQGTSIGRATFESNAFFNFDFYMGLQGMDYVHPLAQLYTYSNMLGGRTFAVTGYASYAGFPAYQIRHQLMSLSKLGFVYYDDATDMLTLRQKLFDYIVASMRQRDYDVIRFISRTESASIAALDLDSRDLTIKGIPVIFLSDSQNVRLIPKETSIVMKRNRSFQFDGIVDAGLVRFSGNNFFFDYDSFKISLQKIDSLQLSIMTGQYNQYGEPILTRIDNAIEDMSGELLIDHPQNKSGLESYPQYPTFISRGESYIYFDKKNIQNGVYSRNEFYFELEPFTIDSLDNFRPEAISPSGTFISAGILPPLQMEMTLRKDNSLGFYMETPEEGILLYEGTGTFFNDIEMSSKGLHGYGSFDYLTSTTWSDDFLMHPDSMMAQSRRYLVREKLDATEFPYVENTEAGIKLFPHEEVMHVSRTNETFKIFNDSMFHGGNLALRPSGLSGDGVMAIPDARLESDNFRYRSRSILADSAGIQLKAQSAQEFPFFTNDVNLNIDLDARQGEIRANADYTLVELPYNLYETRLDQMTWFMDRGEVAMSQGKYLPDNDVDIGIDSLKSNGPTYLSKHPQQDELKFVAPVAVYNYRTRLLHASRVPFIEVADAYVFPYTGEVEVGYQATMGLLEDAKVLASQLNRQHLIYDASIAVNGAKDYAGSGYYDYRDAFGNNHPVYFDRIWVDTTIQSRSSGKVEEDDPFMLSPFFDFQGEVRLSATNPFLTFDGGTRIVHDCDIGKAWLRFTSEIDPADIYIPVDEQMKNVALNKIFAGSMITRDSTHIYSTFVSGRKDYFDANIAGASGILLYDPKRESYIISTPEKIADSTLPGKYLRLEVTNCLVYGEGPVDLTLDYGQVKITSTGNAVHRVNEEEFSAHLVLGLDFHFSPEALQVMGSEIDSLPDLEPVDLTRHHYNLAMRDLLGETQARKLERELVLTGVYKEIPPAWKNTIFFNDLPLKWNQNSRSFRFNGKVGIGNIGDIQVNKKVDAYVELVEKGSGDIFDIYLKVDRNIWYYIAYSPGGLQVLSSNRDFNDIVYNLKAADRRVKAKLGQAQYVYSLAAQRRLDLFINRFLEYEEEAVESEVF
ncbi:MAG: hypothetical protein KAR19_13330 [Bacteroidales bacterium]|nr:hypothetical protein [Bacteroidales bacterium]